MSNEPPLNVKMKFKLELEVDGSILDMKDFEEFKNDRISMFETLLITLQSYHGRDVIPKGFSYEVEKL